MRALATALLVALAAAAAAADARIEQNDLGALLYAQGYPRREWETG